MHVEWHGQSAFTLTAPEATVFIDPFGDMGPLEQRGMRFDYPPEAPDFNSVDLGTAGGPIAVVPAAP
jgi:L-ascorbate metabolism protein UlaG (beta-lactamase superfamily)